MHLPSFKNVGLARLSLDYEVRERLFVAVKAWQEFCRLDATTKELMLPGSRYVGQGYFSTRAATPKEDTKELVEVTVSALPAFYNVACFVDPAAETFVKALFDLHGALASTLSEIAKALEDVLRIPLCAEVEKSLPYVHYRFLRYPPGPRSVFAHPHVDRCGFTIHVYESHEGFEILNREQAWEAVSLSTSEALLLTSMGLQHASSSDVKAVWHRVMSNEQTRREGRYSIVIFVPLSGHAVRSDMRMQDLAIGSTITMPRNEFDLLFAL